MAFILRYHVEIFIQQPGIYAKNLYAETNIRHQKTSAGNYQGGTGRHETLLAIVSSFKLLQGIVLLFYHDGANIQNESFVGSSFSIDSTMVIEDPPGEAQMSMYGRTERKLGQTDYIGVSGAFGLAPSFPEGAGFFVNRKKRRMSDVTDGTSNTMMFGENEGGTFNNGSGLLGWMWIGSVGMSVFNELSTRRDATIDQFSSKHPGTVNFAFADGAARLAAQS